MYFQDRYETKDTTKLAITVSEGDEITLRPNDNLYINVYGVDMGQIDIFNRQTSTTSNYNETTLYMQGYLINHDGFVELPVIGNIKVAGLTLKKAQQAIQDRVDEYIRDAIVDVRLLSYRITLMGEVKQPGTYTFLQRDINILDAIGKAGDIATYGDIKHVLVIRKNGNSTQTAELDLSGSDFYQSPYFWLKPDDVIYVKPLRSKMVSINSPSISILLSGLTTLFLFLTYMQ